MSIDLISASPYARIVTLDKQLTDRLLSMNTHNRAPKESVVKRLTLEIQQNWNLSASGIGVSFDGVLLDGQHRLLAHKNAGYPQIQAVLVTGLGRESQAVVDRHTKRGLADTLTLTGGVTITSGTVAAANALLCIRGSMERDIAFSHKSSSVINDSLVSRFIDLYHEQIEIVLRAVSSKSAVVAAMFVYYMHDPEKCLKLCGEVKTGADIAQNSPAYRLRKYLADNTGGGAQDRLFSFGATVTACIHHSRGNSLQSIRPAISWANAPWKIWALNSEHYA